MNAFDSLTKLITGTQNITVLIAQSLFTLSFVIFMGVIIAFLIKRAKGDPQGMEQMRSMIGWSVIAMFVLMSVWGLVAFLSYNLGIGLGGCVKKPSPVPGQVATSDCTDSSPDENYSHEGNNRPAPRDSNLDNRDVVGGSINY